VVRKFLDICSAFRRKAADSAVILGEKAKTNHFEQKSAVKRHFSRFIFRLSYIADMVRNNGYEATQWACLEAGVLRRPAALPEPAAPSLPKLLSGLDRSEWRRFKLFRKNHHKTYWTAPLNSP
jgi:hypothetical protein